MRGYEINYTQFCWLACVGCVQVFVTQNGDYLSFNIDIASSFNISIITGYVAQAFEELYYGKSPKTGWKELLNQSSKLLLTRPMHLIQQLQLWKALDVER